MTSIEKVGGICCILVIIYAYIFNDYSTLNVLLISNIFSVIKNSLFRKHTFNTNKYIKSNEFKNMDENTKTYILKKYCIFSKI